MMHRSPRAFAPGASSRGLFLAAALLATVVPARADVTLKEEMVSSGLAGFENGTSERTVVIAGDRSRTDESNTYTGRFQTMAGGGKAHADAPQARAQDRKKKDEQEDAAAADNAVDAGAHGNVGGALGGMLGHRLGKAFQMKAEASTTSGAGSSGAQDGGLTITTDVVSVTTGSAGASHDVPAGYKKVERKQQ